MKATASGKAEPEGILRIGVVHALAEVSFADALHGLGQCFPRLSLQLTAGWTADLVEAVERGGLDAAVVLSPGIGGPVTPVPSAVAGLETLALVGSARLDIPEQPVAGDLAAYGWILTPDQSCAARATLKTVLERGGAPFRIAAEVHDVDLQVSLIERGFGIGPLPMRRVSALAGGRGLRVIDLPGLSFGMAISVIRSPLLGRAAVAVDAFQASLAGRFRSGEESATGIS